MRSLPPLLRTRLNDLAASDAVRPIDLALARMLAGIDHDHGADLERSARIALSAALVSQARRDGHTAIVLSDHARQSFPGTADKALPTLPDLATWTAALAESPVVGAPGGLAPLVTDGVRLALGRFWNAEQRVATDVRARAAADVPETASESVRTTLAALFPDLSPDETDQQAVATVAALCRRLLLVAGGPGTGKTYTATRILALLLADGVLRPSGAPAQTVALAAPTAKAAQRLGESLQQGLSGIPALLAERVPTDAMTLHRLLRYNPALGFGHTARNPLPHDLVLVDEGSMVDLMLFDALLAALRPEARLIVLGDPNQLASVEAGAVFGDLCAAGAGNAPTAFSAFCASLGVTGVPEDSGDRPLGGMVVTLTESRRFSPDSGVGRLAHAVLLGDGNATVAALTDEQDLGLVETLPAQAAVDWVVPHARRVLDARTPEEALAALDTFRLLAVVRRGPRGVDGLNLAIEERLRLDGLARWNPYAAPFYNGRPLIVTVNDAEQGLWNGEVGVCWQEPTQRVVVFGSGRSVALGRMPAHEPAWALTVHKSQGSEFDAVGVVLPEEETRGAEMMARDLLYTAATRSKREVSVFGSAALVRHAAGFQRERVSGLVEALGLGGLPP